MTSDGKVHGRRVAEPPEIGPAKPDGASAILMKSSDLVDNVDSMMEIILLKTGIKKMVSPLVSKLFVWSQINSLHPLHFGIKCCALEMAATSAPRYDAERFGIIFRSSPRQCDVLLVTGPVSYKLKPKLLNLYEQMPEPKWVIAMGECCISGGPFYNSYAVVPGVDTYIPVDIYIPGCPVRPEGLIDGFIKLQELIKSRRKDMFEHKRELYKPPPIKPKKKKGKKKEKKTEE